MWNGYGVLSLYLAAVFCQIAGVQAQGGEEAGRAGGKELPEVPAELITALAHEKFKERHAAQKALMAWGRKDLGGSIESLYRLYRKAENPEVRLRSREVLKALVIIQQPLPGQGYLGIQMDTARWKDGEGVIQPAVLITDVREGTAAAVAKLKADDLIIGVDQVVFDDLAPTRRFADYIRSKKPGDEITLKVRRGMERLELIASLRRRPAALDEINQWGLLPVLPQESKMDEDYFQEWLRERTAKERKNNKD